MTKETESYSIDYEFISKYIRDDSKEVNRNVKRIFEKDKENVNEVFSSVGEGENFSSNPIFHKKFREEDLGLDVSKIETESESNPLSEEKKEFIKHLEDDSLTIDAAERLNH